MKIGIFGDSYCDKSRLTNKEPIVWYNFLKTEYGHDIDCFGEWGSSILFSAKLIKEHATKYDLVIWCVTTPGRFSFPNSSSDRAYNITTSWDECHTDDPDLAKKHQVCLDYLKYVFDWETENLVGESVVKHIQNLFGNIMVIPCFPPPLSAEFNLYKVCENEADVYFPGKKIHEIYEDYLDTRAGHLTLENHKILARLINDNLKPGVFQTSYDNFVKPTLPLDKIFKPKGFTLPNPLGYIPKLR
jgi:hypothetical protein